MALAIDGTPSSNNSITTGSGTVTLTTTSTNDVIIIISYIENTNAQGSTNKVTSVSATSGTGTVGSFTKRSATNGQPGLNSGGQLFNGLEVWWAVASTALTSKVFTVNFNIAADNAVLSAFAVSGSPSPSSPWDPNVSLPNVAINTAGSGATTPTSGSCTTTNAGGLVIYALETANPNIISVGPGVPTGTTTIMNTENGGGSQQIYCSSARQATSLSSTVVIWPNTEVGWIAYVDALTSVGAIVPFILPQACM